MPMPNKYSPLFNVFYADGNSNFRVLYIDYIEFWSLIFWNFSLSTISEIVRNEPNRRTYQKGWFFYVGFFFQDMIHTTSNKYIAATINKLQFKDGKLKPLMETSHFLLAPQKVFMSRHFKKCVRPLILCLSGWRYKYNRSLGVDRVLT